MPLSTSDIVYRYSNITATAGNTNTGSSPTGHLAARCLGKFMSTVPWTGGVANDLFDNIGGGSNSAGRTDYRCVFVANLHASLTLYDAVAYIPAQVTGGADNEISLEYRISDDSVRVVPIGGSSHQAIALLSSTDAPIDSLGGWDTNFVAAAGVDQALPIGDIPPQQCCPIWVKRTATNSSAVNLDGVTIRVEGDSPE